MERRIPIFLTAVIAAMAGSLCQPLFAFTPGACRDDMQKYCANAEPGAKQDCMKQHEADLSPACKENIKEGKEKRQEVMDACKDDLKQFCPNVTPGEGRQIACLRAYEDKLSAGCKEKLPKRGMMHRGMKHGKAAGQNEGGDHDGGDGNPPAGGQ